MISPVKPFGFEQPSCPEIWITSALACVDRWSIGKVSISMDFWFFVASNNPSGIKYHWEAIYFLWSLIIDLTLPLPEFFSVEMRWVIAIKPWLHIHSYSVFHLVTWNPAIFLSSVWSIATCNKPCIKSQTTKAPWKPPIHYQTLWVEWLVTFKKWNLELAFFWTNFLTPKVA